MFAGVCMLDDALTSFEAFRRSHGTWLVGSLTGSRRLQRQGLRTLLRGDWVRAPAGRHALRPLIAARLSLLGWGRMGSRT